MPDKFPQVTLNFTTGTSQSQFPDYTIEDGCLPAHCPAYPGGIIHHHHSQDSADSKQRGIKTGSQCYRCSQGTDHCRVRTGHTATGYKKTKIEALLLQCFCQSFEHLCYRPHTYRHYQHFVGNNVSNQYPADSPILSGCVPSTDSKYTILYYWSAVVTDTGTGHRLTRYQHALSTA